MKKSYSLFKLKTSFGYLTIRKFFLLMAVMAGLVFKPEDAKAITQTYYIAAGNLVNCPSYCGTDFSYYNDCAGGIPGFNWNDVLPGSAAVTSVTIQLMPGVECGAGTRTTSVNGAGQSSFNTAAWCQCSGTANSVQTVTVSPANYIKGGTNTFRITNPSSCFGFIPTGSLSGYYAIVTVNYVTDPFACGWSGVNSSNTHYGETRIVPPCDGSYVGVNTGSGTYQYFTLYNGSKYEFLTDGSSPFTPWLTIYDANPAWSARAYASGAINYTSTYSGDHILITNRAGCQQHDFTGQSAVLRVREVVSAGTITPSATSICVGGTVTFNITGSTGKSRTWMGQATGVGSGSLIAGWNECSDCYDDQTSFSRQFNTPGVYLIRTHARGRGSDCWNWGSSSDCYVTVLSPPLSGALTLNGTAGNISVCAGSTVTIAQAGGSFPNANYWYWIGPDRGDGWVNSWDQMSQGNGNVASFGYTFNTPGNYVIHSNANSAECGWTAAGGITRLVSVKSTANNTGTISLSAYSTCAGTPITVNNVTAASTGAPASAGPSYYYYWRRNSAPVVSWTMYDGPTGNLSSSLPAAVTNTAGSYEITRNSEFGCAGQQSSNIVGLTVNAQPAAPQAVANIIAGPVPSFAGTALLPDANITAASNCCGDHEAYKGRLFNPGYGYAACWASATNALNSEWWQVDMGSIKPVNGIATQGRGDCCDQRVLTYTVLLSMDGSNWFSVPGTFNGNTDANTVVTNMFGLYHARYVRIYPQTINNHMSMRADVISIPEEAAAVSLSSEIPAGATTVRWYDAPSGGTLLATSPFYTTPVLSQNTTYYASGYNASTGCEGGRTAVVAKINDMYGPGPGAVGNTNAKSDLKLWLNAEAINQGNGTGVATWGDLSGYGNNLVAASGGNPTLTASVMNGRPVVRYNGSNYGYTPTSFGNPYTILTASKISGSQRFLSSNNINWLLGYWGGMKDVMHNNGWVTYPGPGVDAANYIYSCFGNSRATRFFRNGADITGNETGGFDPPGQFSLGGWSGASEQSAGDAAEIVLFEKVLNSARQNIVENYLSSKYGIAVANDLYAGDLSGNGACDYDVAGIGRTVQGWHQKTRSGGLFLNDGAFLNDNGDYILLGRNSGTGSWETSNLTPCGSAPNASTRRISRIWWIQRADAGAAGGNVTLSFDLNALQGAAPIAGTYRLLNRAGNSGNFTALSGAPAGTISGNTVQFTLNASAFSTSGGQYTLGYEADVPSAIAFNGSSNYVEVQTSPTLQTSGDFTYEMWVKPAAINSLNTYFENGTWSGQTILFRQDAPGAMNVYINGTTSGSLGYTPPVGQWTHLALVRSGGTITIYANGVSIGNVITGYSTPIMPVTNMRIGSSMHSGGQLFNGLMDEFRLWDIARSAGQIQADMHTDINNTHGQWNNLQAYYKFNEASGKVSDLSKNNNEGTPVNAPVVTTLYAASPSVSGTNSLCIGTTANYSISAANTNSRLTYNWSVSGGTLNSGQGTANANITWTSGGTGTINVTVTHSNECRTETASLNVAVNASPSASVTGTDVICAGASSTFTASGGTGYAWSHGPVTAAISVSSAATYTVTVTNGAGCTAVAGRTLTVNALPASSPGLSPTAICAGGSSTLSANASAGSGSITTYAWSTGLGNVASGTVSPAGTTNYTVTVTNSNGCSSTAGPVTLTINASPTASPSLSAPSGCSGSPVTLSANASAGSGTITTYAWSSGLGNVASGPVSPITTTNYTVTVTNSNGCSITGGPVTLTIVSAPSAAPTTAVSSPASSCSGSLPGTVTLIASGGNPGTGGTANWYTDGCGTTFLSNGSSPTIVNPGATTTYYVRYENSCGSSACAQVTYTVNATPSAGIAGNTAICTGGSTTLTATGGTGYVWSTTETTAAINVSTAATYTVTVSGAGGCTATAGTAVTISANPAASPSLSPTTICAGGSSTLSANASAGSGTITAYAWSSGLGNVSGGTVSPITTTAYTITVTNSNGCSITAGPVTLTVAGGLSAMISEAHGQTGGCSGDTFSLTASGSGGLGTPSYQFERYISGVWTAVGSNAPVYNTGAIVNTGGTDITASYRVVYSTSGGGCGSGTSPQLDLIIFAKPTAEPEFDDCAAQLAGTKYSYIILTNGGAAPPFHVNDSTNLGAVKMYSDADTSFVIYRLPQNGTNAPYVFTTTDANGCSVTSTFSRETTYPNTIVTANTSGSTFNECQLRGWNEWEHFQNPNNKDEVIMSVNPKGVDLGKVTVSSYVDAPGISVMNSGTTCAGVSQAAMRRHYKITSSAFAPGETFTNGANVGVRLYFSAADFAELSSRASANDDNNNSCTTDDNITDMNELFVTKYSDNTGSGTENGTYGDNDPASGIYKVFGPSRPNSAATYAGPVSDVQPGGFDAVFQPQQATGHNYIDVDVTEFSEFWLHGSAGGSPLPVKMLYIEAKGIENTFIRVDWATSTEIDNWKFEVERSEDGKEFTKVGEVIGHATTSERQDYLYNDVTVKQGIRYYYRLKQVDFDGRYEYSPVVSAKLEVDDAFSVGEFVPNPTSGRSSLTFRTKANKEVSVKVVNYLGAVVMEQGKTIRNADNTMYFDFDKLAAGTYMVSISTAEKTYARRIVLTR
jgi:hypothetical protein